MEWTEVKEFLDANKETDANVKLYLEGFNPLKGVTDDNVNEFVESNLVLKSYRDKTATKGIETWKGNNLQGLLTTATEEEAKKHKKSPETPLEKEVRELKEELTTERKEKTLNVLKDSLRAKATELGYDPELAVDFAGDDADAATVKMMKHAKAWAGYDEKVRNEVLVDGKVVPKKGEDDKDPPKFESRADGNSKEFEDLINEISEKDSA
jgi:hypothetical protein